jgi:hypothetical protein
MSRPPYTDGEIRDLEARKKALDNESRHAYLTAKAMENAGQYGPALAAAKAKHDELSKACFALGHQIRDMQDAREEFREAEQKAAEKAHRKSKIYAWANPFISNVHQAGEQVDDALLNLVDAVADLARAQAPMADLCPQTQHAFTRANGMLIAVLARKLNGFGGFRGDKRMLPESFFATYSQHLPQED